MDFGPNNWYPEPVPTWNLQTPTIFVPPSPTLVKPLLSPPPTIPTFASHPAAVQILDAFATFQQGMNECFNDYRAGLDKIQERLQESRRLIQERGRLLQALRSKVPTAAPTPRSGPRYAPEDPTLPSPWRGLIDGSTGSLYYWNTESNHTQYERPRPQALQCPPTLTTSVSSNPPPYTSDYPPLIHPTQPISLHRKQLRVLRRRASVAATRRQFKATQKPNLLSTVGNDSRTQVNRKKGLWAGTTQNGYVFSMILEEIRQLCVGIEPTNSSTGTLAPPATDPPPSQLLSDVSEQKEDPHPMAVSALTGELEKPRLPLLVTAATDGSCDALSKVLTSTSADSCTHSDLSYQIHPHASDATNIYLEIRNVVELQESEAIDKQGFLVGEEDPCSGCFVVKQETLKQEWNRELALVYQCCKLGNFARKSRIMWDEVKYSLDSTMVKYSLNSTMVNDVSFSYGTLCEENLFGGHNCGQWLLNAAMGTMTRLSLSPVSPTPHFHYQGVRRVSGSFLSGYFGVLKLYNCSSLHSTVEAETWFFADRIEKIYKNAVTLADCQLARKLTLDGFLVATDLGSQMVPLGGGTGMVNKREVMPMVIVNSLSWMHILLSKRIRMEPDESNWPLRCRWLSCCLFLFDSKLHVATLADTMHSILNGNHGCLPPVEVVTQLDNRDRDTAAPTPFSTNLDSCDYAQFSSNGHFLVSSSFEGFVEVVETPKNGHHVQVMAVFSFRQPFINQVQLVYLRTLEHATLPNALCFSPSGTSVPLLTHSAMIPILLPLHTSLHKLGLRTQLHELDFSFMTSWAYIVHALPLIVSTVCMAGNIACHLHCQCQPRWYFVDKVVASVNRIAEFSIMGYYSASLLPRDYGGFPITFMNGCFHYMVRNVHQDMFFKVNGYSAFYSPFCALGRKMFSLSHMAAIQLLGSLLATILRDDDHYIIGMLVAHSIIQLASLKYMKHGLAIKCVLHCQMAELVISSLLLQSPNKEALQVFSRMQHLYRGLSQSNSPVSFHLCAIMHTWPVKAATVAFVVTVTKIKDLKIIHSTFWGLPLLTWGMLIVTSWFRYLDLAYPLSLSDISLLDTIVAALSEQSIGSIEFHAKLHNVGDSLLNWVRASSKHSLASHSANQMVGWTLIVELPERSKESKLQPWIVATANLVVDALTTDSAPFLSTGGIYDMYRTVMYMVGLCGKDSAPNWLSHCPVIQLVCSLLLCRARTMLLLVDFILLLISYFGRQDLQLNAAGVNTSLCSLTWNHNAEADVTTFKVPVTHRSSTLHSMKIYEAGGVSGYVAEATEKRLFGSDLPYAAWAPATVRAATVQASQAWLFAGTIVSLATSLILGALLTSTTPVPSHSCTSFGKHFRLEGKPVFEGVELLGPYLLTWAT